MRRESRSRVLDTFIVVFVSRGVPFPQRSLGETERRRGVWRELASFLREKMCRAKKRRKFCTRGRLEAGDRSGLESSSSFDFGPSGPSKPAVPRGATVHVAYRLVHESRFISTITLAIARVSNGATTFYSS